MAMSKDSDGRTLLVSSLWLHGGFIGAAVAGAGVLQLCDGDLGWASGLGLVLSGALVAAACWRRGWVVVRNAMRDTVPRPAASPGYGLVHASRMAAPEAVRALVIDSEVI